MKIDAKEDIFYWFCYNLRWIFHNLLTHCSGFTVEEVKAEDDLSKWRSHGIKEGK